MPTLSSLPYTNCFIALAAAVVLLTLYVMWLARRICRVETTPSGPAAIESIKNRLAELDRRSMTDRVTGLLNGQYLLQVALPDTMRRHRRLVVAFIDLDDFRQINNTHGHTAGDRALCTAARAMRQALQRSTDRLFRLYAGDEFVLLLPDATEPVAKAILTSISAELAQANLSASIGAIVIEEGCRLEPEALVQQADRLMTEVKRQGKGLVRMARATRPAVIAPDWRLHLKKAQPDTSAAHGR